MKNLNLNLSIDDLMTKAIHLEDLDEIKKLINQGANINGFLIKEGNNEKIIGINKLLLAIELNAINAAICLIENGADVHAENEEALCWSIRKGYVELIKVLLEHGANLFVDKKDGYVWTGNKKHNEAIEYVLSFDIDIEKTFICQNVIGKTKLLVTQYVETKKLKEELEIKLQNKEEAKNKKNKL